jgi:hypothetical protein
MLVHVKCKLAKVVASLVFVLVAVSEDCAMCVASCILSALVLPYCPPRPPRHVGKDGSNALVQACHARLQILPVHLYIDTHTHTNQPIDCIICAYVRAQRFVFERRLLFCEWHWCVDFRAERESVFQRGVLMRKRECVFDKRVCCNGAFREFRVDLARFSNRRDLQRAFCFTVSRIAKLTTAIYHL